VHVEGKAEAENGAMQKTNVGRVSTHDVVPKPCRHLSPCTYKHLGRPNLDGGQRKERRGDETSSHAC